MGNKQASLVPYERVLDLTPTTTHTVMTSPEGENGLLYWFSIVLGQAVVQLSFCDLKQCTLICKSISQLVRDYIQRNFWFSQHDDLRFKEKNDPEKRYLWYAPCYIRNVKNISTLPINTTKIQFFPTFNSLFTFPLHLEHVTHIKLGNLFNQRIGCGIKSEINNLPLTLTHLTLSPSFNNSVDDLPPNLIFLSCGFSFNNLVDSLPPKLTHLYFETRFNNRVDSLPPKLTHLTFLDNFNQPINKLPLSLTHLTIVRSYIRSHFIPPLDQLQRNFESNLEYLVLNPVLAERYDSFIPPNFVRLGESEQYRYHIVYKRKTQQ